MLETVFLGLGANLGEPEAQLCWAVNKIRQDSGFRLAGISSLYRTQPVGAGLQPEYFNAVVCLQTHYSPQEVLRFGLQLEAELGRVRSGRNAPRVLDIDLLLYGGMRIHEPELQVPHYALAERAFVLVPLAEIAPEARHPVLGKTAAELLARISQSGVRVAVAGAKWAETNEGKCR